MRARRNLRQHLGLGSHRSHLTGRRPRSQLDRPTGLLPASDRTAETDVLNGIAYDATRNRLFVTGKLWPKLFEIRLGPLESGEAHSASVK